MATKCIAEILKQASEIASRKERVAFLQKNSSPALKAVLGHAFDPNVKWALPGGKPPYKPMHPAADVESRLHYESTKFKYFIVNQSPNLKQMKREMMFIQVLESVDPRDAELLCAVKDKTIPYKGITAKLVQEAFPGIAKHWKV